MTAAVVGLLLAAGAGRRYGGPKGLVDTGDGPWVVRAARVLAAGGCAPVVVVVGAAAPEVRAVLAGEPVEVVEAPGWDEGVGASLRAGLAAVAGGDAVAAVVHLVDLPDVGAEVVRRLVAVAGPAALARAAYDGVPGHPVLLGRDHWAGVAALAEGDAGARAYLRAHDDAVALVDATDLATGLDVDHPPPHR